MLILSRYTISIVFNTTLFFSVAFRTFLIVHAKGLVWKGQPNLRLFNQLYWTIVVTYVTVLYGLHISITVRGDWPAGLSEGRFCLLMEMEVQKDGQSVSLMIGQLFVPFLMVSR